MKLSIMSVLLLFFMFVGVGLVFADRTICTSNSDCYSKFYHPGMFCADDTGCNAPLKCINQECSGPEIVRVDTVCRYLGYGTDGSGDSLGDTTNYCVSVPCTSNIDCNQDKNEVCRNGNCFYYPRSPCLHDGECQAPLKCVNNECGLIEENCGNGQNDDADNFVPDNLIDCNDPDCLGKEGANVNHRQGTCCSTVQDCFSWAPSIIEQERKYCDYFSERMDYSFLCALVGDYDHDSCVNDNDVVGVLNDQASPLNIINGVLWDILYNFNRCVR